MRISDWSSDVCSSDLVDRHRLDVDRHGDMGRLAIGERGADGELDDILDMGRPHDPRAVGAGIHAQRVELNILLGVGVEEAVEREQNDRASDTEGGCEYW